MIVNIIMMMIYLISYFLYLNPFFKWIHKFFLQRYDEYFDFARKIGGFSILS